MPRRVLGLYALACMDRDGTTYGYRVARRIAERTEGAWRPGPGAIYPALRSLVDRGLARAETRQRRREYRITAEGRALLRGLRRHRSVRASAPDLSVLWAEVVEISDPGELLLRRVRRSVAALADHVGRSTRTGSANGRLRRRALDELANAQRRIARSGPRPARAKG